jgi:Bax protein
MYQLRIIFFWSMVLFLLILSFSSAYAQTKPDFKKYAAGPERKKVFISYVRPLIDKANAAIMEDRKFILNLHNNINLNKKISEIEKGKLAGLIDYYKVKEDLSVSMRLDKLKEKVNIFPDSLILAQASLESAWGTSRFAVKGNNFFGQHCFTKSCGMSASGDEKVEVAIFTSVFDSIQSYYRNLNSGDSYKKLRRLRSEEISKLKKMDSLELTKGLSDYSTLGNGDYAKRLNEVITFDKLQQYDY